MPKTNLKQHIAKLCNDYSEVVFEESKNLFSENPDLAVSQKEIRGNMLNGFKDFMKGMKRAFLIIGKEKLVHTNILKEIEPRLKRKIANKTLEGEDEMERDLLGLDIEDMQKIYSCGMKYFDKGNFRVSSDLFLLLTTVLPTSFDFWLAFGFSEERRDEFNSAFFAFNMAASQGGEKIAPFVNAAECLYKDGKHKEAGLYIVRVLRDIEDRGEIERYGKIIEGLDALRKKYQE